MTSSSWLWPEPHVHPVPSPTPPSSGSTSDYFNGVNIFSQPTLNPFVAPILISELEALKQFTRDIVVVIGNVTVTVTDLMNPQYSY